MADLKVDSIADSTGAGPVSFPAGVTITGSLGNITTGTITAGGNVGVTGSVTASTAVSGSTVSATTTVSAGSTVTATTALIGATGQINSISNTAGTGVVAFPNGVNLQTNYFRAHTNNGKGSAAGNKIARLLTTVTNSATAFTYTDDAVNGAKWVANRVGYMMISLTDVRGAAASTGLSLNSTQLTTSIFNPAFTTADRLMAGASTGDGDPIAMSWAGQVALNDTIRIHTDGGADSSLPERMTMTVIMI